MGLDEAISVDRARLGLGELAGALAGGQIDPNMSLYYLLLHGWLRLWGEGEVAVRSLSAIAAAFAAAATCGLGTRLFGTAAGVAAGVALASNPFFVTFAQTARSYTLAAFFVVASSAAFVDLVERADEPRRATLRYVVASALAVYAHFFAMLALLSQAGVVLMLRGRAAFGPPWRRAAGALCVALAPAIACAVRMGPQRVIGWIDPPVAGDLLRIPTTLAGGSAVVLAALLAAGGLAALRASDDAHWWRRAYAAVWFALPIALSFCASFVQPMFVDYYLLVTAPALCLFGASALAGGRHSVAAGIALAAIILPIRARALAGLYASQPLEDWRAAAEFVAARSYAGDAAVILPDYAHRPFRYAMRRAGGPALDIAADIDDAARIAGRRVWFIQRTADTRGLPDEVRRIDTALTTGRRMAAARSFANVSVTLYH